MAFFWFSSYENKFLKENLKKTPLSMTSFLQLSHDTSSKIWESKLGPIFPGLGGLIRECKQNLGGQEKGFLK